MIHETSSVQENSSHLAALCPQARRDEAIVTQTVFDEVVVYDLQRHKAHQLNPTAATVWQWCDGATPTEAMIDRLAARYSLPISQAEPLLWLTLEKLGQAKLLTSHVSPSKQMAGVSRRQLLRIMAVASLLPVVYTIAAPMAVHAQSTSVCTNCNCAASNTGNGDCYSSSNCTGALVSVGGNTNIKCTTCDGAGGNSWKKGGTCYQI